MRQPARAPRGSLSRERIRTAATELADATGIGGVTIRAIAARLSVKPMAIYHHVASKEEILDDVVDEIYAQIHRPEPNGPWRIELAARARSMRAVLARHPWALALMETRRHPGPANRANHEALLDLLLTAGFSMSATGHAAAVLDAFVFGFALQEAMLSDLGLIEDPAELLAGMDLSDSPRMTQFAREHILVAGYAFGDSFEVGLGLVLDGLQTLRDAPSD